MENMNTLSLTEANHLSVCSQRGLLFDIKSQRKLTRLLAGKMGEEEVVEVLKKYLPKEWLILRNVWLEIDGNRTEIDILVVAPKYYWVIEVKNYEGKFEYQDHLCYLNQKQIPDQLAAYRNRMRIVKHIIQKIPRYVPVVCGSMVFINERCQVTCEELPDCSLVMRYQLVWHIQEMLKLHQQLTHYIKIEDSLTLVQNYQIDNPFQPEQLNKSDFDKMAKGFCCPKCRKINSQLEHRHVRCNNCQHRVTKTEAVLRAVCELGVLYYDEPSIITTARIFEFVGGAVNLRTIRNILKAYLPSYGKNSATTYHNYGATFEEIGHLFRKEVSKKIKA